MRRFDPSSPRVTEHRRWFKTVHEVHLDGLDIDNIQMSMIDKFQRLALAIQMLRQPSVVVGWISLASLVIIIFFSAPHQGDRFIIPSFVGLLWAISTYAFIVAFRSVPEKSDKTSGGFSRLMQKIKRGWYGFISVVFLCTTMVVIGLTYRMISIWLREYGN